jgi:hypothetical protein
LYEAKLVSTFDIALVTNDADGKVRVEKDLGDSLSAGQATLATE